VRTGRAVIDRAEGERLYSRSNDIILRLPGLSFDVNQSDIKDDHIPLLEKVRKIIELFDYSQIVIEGHTDSRGDPSSNTSLS